LLVAEATIPGGGTQVVAFGGMTMVPAADGDPDRDAIAMVTDLFVADDLRGMGIGALVLDELVGPHRRRMTSSSKHAAALPVYARAGMEPRWNLLYLAGVAVGDGPPLRVAPWAHDRADLVAHFATLGATVTADAVVLTAADGATAEVLRMHSDNSLAEMSAVLAALPAGRAVRACVPAWHPLAEWLLRLRGFRVEDHDVWCTTDDIVISPAVSCVHAGLA